MMAVASGLLAVATLVTPTATADEGRSRATASQLAVADAAILEADIAGTAWYTDATTGKVVVTVDGRVGAAEVTALKRAVKAPVGALEINRTSGTFTKLIAGGEAITASGIRCSLGFNVQSSGGTKYALTAGHCTNLGRNWNIGTTVATSFPNNDYGLIQHSNPAAADGRVSLHNGTYQDITTAGSVVVGQPVCQSGSTTGVHCGTVTALNVTINYGADTVSGLGRTNSCSEPGDSGGSVFQGSTAVGIISGGSGNCTSGGITFYQPILEALNAYGLSVF
ncbi:S1 family peptidase [Streptomyces sp. NPDC058280]|uniref:S1 family peptidase n=1 Tax=Streptomyces sp. NPDC058280 TaxID=3346419 RepID=UPI0036ED467F